MGIQEKRQPVESKTEGLSTTRTEPQSRLRLLLESFRSAHLIKKVMVIAILDGVELGIRVPALLYEFTSFLGYIGIRFPVAWSIDVTSDAHSLLFFRSKYLFI